MNDVKDMSATVVGGSLGLDTLYDAINQLLTDGAVASEWALLFKGLFLIIFGYFSFKR